MGGAKGSGAARWLRTGWAETLQCIASPESASSQAAEGKAATARRNNFHALRLLAALLVVYGHQTADLTGTYGLRLVMFFSISGFLVAGSWNSDPHAGRFIVRRFLRIWPAYAALIVICAAGSALFPVPSMPDLSRLASLLYLSNLWYSGFDWSFFPGPSPSMNQSLWMMPFEVNMYIAFAVLALAGRKLLALAAAVVLLAALRAPQTEFATGGLLECWSLFFGGFFAFGVLMRRFAWLRQGRVVMALVALGAVLLGIGERTAGLLFVIPPAAVWIGERSWPVLRSADRFGDLSFGIFLWSWPVQQVTRLWLDTRTPMLLQLGVVLVQVLAIAWLSWRWIEAPALRRKPRKPSAASSPKDFQDLAST
jgi:peptidoglycan/LPS O-acetylase OafA/YrhL